MVLSNGFVAHLPGNDRYDALLFRSGATGAKTGGHMELELDMHGICLQHETCGLDDSDTSHKTQPTQEPL